MCCGQTAVLEMAHKTILLRPAGRRCSCWLRASQVAVAALYLVDSAFRLPCFSACPLSAPAALSCPLPGGPVSRLPAWHACTFWRPSLSASLPQQTQSTAHLRPAQILYAVNQLNYCGKGSGGDMFTAAAVLYTLGACIVFGFFLLLFLTNWGAGCEAALQADC